MLEGLSVTLGYRYTWDNKDFDAITYGIASMFPLDRTFGGCRILDENGDPVGNDQPGCRRPNSARWKEPSWTASFEWQATDDLLVYIAHRLGYRSGRLNRRALLPMEFEPVDPELVHDIELGIKADWMLFDVPIRTNVSGFGIRYTNRQAGCSIPGGPGGVFQTIEQNTGSDEITGYEIQVSARPLDALSADAWFSFNRGVTEEVIADPLPGSSVCRTQELDAEFFAPKWRAGVTASYVFPLSPELGEVALIANVNLVDDDKAGDPLDPAPTLDQGELRIYNLRLEWRNVLGRSVDLTPWGRNLSDEDYGSPGDILGLRGYFLREPRTYGANLSWRFGG